MVKEAESFVAAFAKDPDTTNSPFGGEAGWEETAASYEFLANLFCQLCQQSSVLDGASTDTNDQILIRNVT
jgi:hypothetical protein